MFNFDKNFWLFRLGQFISHFGDTSANIAFAWWVLEKTGSATKMAFFVTVVMVLKFCSYSTPQLTVVFVCYVG